MTMRTLAPEHIAQIAGLVAEYMTTKRNRYIDRAMPLSVEQRNAVAAFFVSQLLDETRLIVLVEERVVNPDFYPGLRHAGVDSLPDQSAMDAITFSDCVVSHVAFTDELLFHELVHVEQYRQLGVPKFADLYVRGLFSVPETSS